MGAPHKEMKGQETASLFKIFRFADGIDKLLVVLGTMGAMGDGMMTPLNFVMMSGIFNSYGKADASLSNDEVDKVSLILRGSSMILNISV